MSDNAQLKAQAKRYKDYQSEYKPVWCPGCGDFGVLNALTKAFALLALAPERIALVAGIGCSSRLPAYTRVYGFHGVHGRALPVATGLALSRPDLTVVATGGDGDGFSIGGNHFIHACRRNVNLTYLVMDNAIYGMTKGQPSPTTESDWTGSRLAPQGTHQPPFRPLELAMAAGAPFVARAFSNAPNDLARIIADAIVFPGFAFIHILSPCITYRPEHLQWKERMHPSFTPAEDRRHAFLALLDDDGFGTGIVFREPRPCFHPDKSQPKSLADIAAGFEVTP